MLRLACLAIRCHFITLVTDTESFDAMRILHARWDCFTDRNFFTFVTLWSVSLVAITFVILAGGMVRAFDSMARDPFTCTLVEFVAFVTDTVFAVAVCRAPSGGSRHNSRIWLQFWNGAFDPAGVLLLRAFVVGSSPSPGFAFFHSLALSAAFLP